MEIPEPLLKQPVQVFNYPHGLKNIYKSCYYSWIFQIQPLFEKNIFFKLSIIEGLLIQKVSE